MKWVSPIKDEEKLEKFLDRLGEVDEKYRILFEVGIGTGMQLQEILRLKVKDVRRREVFATMLGTRSIRREFRISQDLRQMIDVFTRDREEEDYLIYGHATRKDQPLSREQAYRVLKEAGIRAGIGEVGATTMRKTFAWRYYQRTGDIYYLQDLLGHISPSVTYRYIGIQPSAKVGVQTKSQVENAKARARLYQDEVGIRHVEKIRKALLEIEQEMQSPKNPDAWFGKTESLLNSIDTLLDQYRSL